MTAQIATLDERFIHLVRPVPLLGLRYQRKGANKTHRSVVLPSRTVADGAPRTEGLVPRLLPRADDQASRGRGTKT